MWSTRRQFRSSAEFLKSESASRLFSRVFTLSSSTSNDSKVSVTVSFLSLLHFSVLSLVSRESLPFLWRVVLDFFSTDSSLSFVGCGSGCFVTVSSTWLDSTFPFLSNGGELLVGCKRFVFLYIHEFLDSVKLFESESTGTCFLSSTRFDSILSSSLEFVQSSYKEFLHTHTLNLREYTVPGVVQDIFQNLFPKHV